VVDDVGFLLLCCFSGIALGVFLGTLRVRRG
jgi:hypothetical protein